MGDAVCGNVPEGHKGNSKAYWNSKIEALFNMLEPAPQLGHLLTWSEWAFRIFEWAPSFLQPFNFLHSENKTWLTKVALQKKW